jgi:mRNA degradation ribonuclease J1/J2
LPNGEKGLFFGEDEKVIFSVKFLYNSRIFIFWVGLNFPKNLEADGIMIFYDVIRRELEKF